MTLRTLSRYCLFLAVLPLTLQAALAQTNSVVFVPTITTIVGNGTAGNNGNGGAATAAEIGNPTSVAYDAAGNLYICDKTKNVVRKVNTSGIISTVVGNGTAGYNGDGIAATSAELNAPNGIAVDAAGDIYIADTTNERIRYVSASTGLISTLAGNGTAGFAGNGIAANGSGGTVEVAGPNSVAVDLAGNVYIGDSGNQRLREIVASTGIINTIAGNGTAGDTGDGGAATSAELSGPRAVQVDVYGNIYIVDQTDAVVREITASNNIINTIAGNKVAGDTGDGGAATNAEIDTPNNVVVDNAGNVYIIDIGADSLRVVNYATKVIYTLAGKNSTTGYSGDGGLSTSAILNGPLGVGLSPVNGVMAISDSANHVVRQLTFNTNYATTTVGGTSAALAQAIEVTQPAKVQTLGISHATPADFKLGTVSGCTLPATTNLTADTVCSAPVTFTPTAPGLRTSQVLATDSNSNNYLLGITGIGNAAAVDFTGIISTYAGTGTAGSTGDSGAATLATVNAPIAVALDSANNLYLAGADNKVRVIAAGGGNIATYAGTGAAGSTGDGGAATAALLNTPSGLAIDPSNNLYIADTGNNDIRIVNGATRLISSLPNATTTLKTPKGVAVDSTGNLYIADTGNNVIRKVTVSTSGYSLLAGTVGTAGSTGDGGAATAALLSAPAGLAVDTAGNIYIADTGNNKVRKITLSTGVISTVAGNGIAGSTGDGAAATSAELSAPTRVAVDAAGNLYIADSGNNKVRFVSASTKFISTITGTGSAGATGDGALATAATLNHASGIALDQFADLYIADTTNNRVRQVIASTTTLAFGAYNPGITSPAQTVTVTNFGNQTLTVTALAVSSAFAQTTSGGTDCSATTTLAPGASCLVSVTFTPTGSGNFTGTVTFTDNALGGTASTQIINLTGTGNVTSPPAKIVANAGNNQTIYPYTAFPVNLQALVTDVNGFGVYGVTVVFTAPTTGATGTFANGTNTVTVTTVAGGYANATVFTAGATRGTFSVTATAAGVTTPATFTETIAGSPVPVVAVSYSPATNPATYGQTITLKATLTPSTLGGNSATGSVVFYDNGKALNSANPSGVSGGQATYALTPAAGSHSYTAAYSGDSNFGGSTSATAATLVVNPLGITATANSISWPYGTSPLPTITGSLNGVLPADVANVTATFAGTNVTSASNAGNYTITTTLSGSAAGNYTVTSTSGTVTVTAVSTSISPTYTPASPGVGQSVTIVAAVTTATGVVPSGNVNFVDNGTIALGSRALGSAGKATLATATSGATALVLGKNTIVATYTAYSGNNNYVTSTVTFVIIVVNPDFAISLGATSLTVQQGAQAYTTYAYTSVGGFASTVTLSCSGLPANAACFFTPTSFTPGTVTSGTGLLDIQTAGGGPTYGQSHTPALGTRSLPLLALFALPTLLFLRRRKRLGSLLMLTLLCIGLGFGTTGCGSGMNNPQAAIFTPVGTSTVTVNASVSGAVVHTATITLIVTKGQ
jgi:hypothetical protein